MKNLLHALSFRTLLPIAAASLLLAAPAPAQNEEFRGLWVDAWGVGFLNASQVAQLVQDARDHNFNAIVVQMRRRGDAFYFPQPPNKDPRTTAIASNYDALAEIIAQAHNGTPRLEVHCWVPTFLVWSNQSTLPSQSGHIFNQHPEYLMKNSNGETFIGEGYYVDPGHPDAMEWTYNMAVDIVSNYDIDGFHWDYIRYPAQNSGFNDTAIARYNAEFGLTGQPSPSDPQFSDWRRRQVTDFLRWVNADILEIRPDLVTSASVFANRTDAYTHRFQDWAKWNADGINDLNMPMNYTSNNSTFNSRVDDAFNHQGIRLTYIGQGAYLNTRENTVTQLNYVRNKPMWGTVFFSYRVPNSGTVNRAATFGYIRDNYQPTWVDTPELVWKTQPDTGIVKGIVTRWDTGEEVYNATVSIDAGPGFSQLSCVRGSYAFYDADDGTWTLTATAPGFGTVQETVAVVPGEVVHVDLVLPDPAEGIIVDNTDPGFSASANWFTATWASDKYGDDYRGRQTEAVSDTAKWEFTVQTRGDYDVFAWWTAGPSRATAASYHIDHADGTNTVQVDQTQNGGQWNLLGNYRFGGAAPTVHSVRLSCWTNSGDIVIADAIRLVPTSVWVDNHHNGFTASSGWFTATWASDKYGPDYRGRTTESVNDPATWTAHHLPPGSYAVQAWWTASPSRATAAPYRVDGGPWIHADQTLNGGQWNTLETPTLSGGSSTVELSCWTGSGDIVIADAVRWVRQ